MRRLSLTIASCCFVFVTALAQEITMTTDTLNESVSKKSYAYQSFDQYDQRVLLKLGAQGGFFYSPGSELRDIPFDLFAVEYRLTKLISIEGTYYFPETDLRAYSFKLRHYLKHGRLANNMSGKYFALEYSHRKLNSISLDKTFFFQFGRQIKKSRFGYADFNMFTSYRSGTFGNALNLGLNVVVGAGWGPTGKRAELDLSSEPPFSSHKEHFLITLENPFVIIGDGFQSYSLATTLEKEIFIKGLTVRTTIGGGYSRQNGGEEFFFRSAAFTISAGVRKYFGLLKKPSADDPIHSFAGFYLGAGANSLYSLYDLKSRIGNESSGNTILGVDRAIPFLGLGYQERLGKRYFFDIFANYSFSSIVNFTQSIRGNGYISFGTRVGLNWGI